MQGLSMRCHYTQVMVVYGVEISDLAKQNIYALEIGSKIRNEYLLPLFDFF